MSWHARAYASFGMPHLSASFLPATSRCRSCRGEVRERRVLRANLMCPIEGRETSGPALLTPTTNIYFYFRFVYTHLPYITTKMIA